MDINGRNADQQATVSAVQLTEVSLRDGLQDLAQWVPTDAKAALVRAYEAAGLTDIEVTSFVRADRVPQLADADRLSALIAPADHPRYSALVPNRRGLSRALDAGYQVVTALLSATDGHSNANLGADVAAWLPRVEAVIEAAKAAGIRVRAAISVAFGCPFEGEVDHGAVVALARRMDAAGADEISLADTIGVATPDDITSLCHRVATAVGEAPSLHLLGPADRAAANVRAGLAAGVRHFDAALTGIGGCPYAPGAPGNLATEELVSVLNGRSPVPAEAVASAAAALRRTLAAAGR